MIVIVIVVAGSVQVIPCLDMRVIEVAIVIFDCVRPLRLVVCVCARVRLVGLIVFLLFVLVFSVLFLVLFVFCMLLFVLPF